MELPLNLHYWKGSNSNDDIMIQGIKSQKPSFNLKVMEGNAFLL